jgi:hypothetical protein
MAATSDRNVARLEFQSASVLIADSARLRTVSVRRMAARR